MNHLPPSALRRLCSVLVAGSLVLAACSSGDDDGGNSGGVSTTEAAPPPGTGEVLEALVTDVIAPGYRALADDLATFASDAEALCAAPSPAAVTDLQAQWRAAVERWQATRPAAVGPAADLRLMSAIGFEARPTSIDKLLAGTDPVDEAAVADEGASVRGLYAAEHVLFGEPSAALASAAGARTCTYLSSVAAVMVEPAETVAADWEGPFGPAFAEGIDGDQQMSVASLLNELTHRVQELDEKGLRDLPAAESVEDLKPGRLDGAAGYGLAGRRALMEGIAALLGDDGTGVGALVAERSPDTAERLTAAVDAARVAMESLPDAVSAAFADREAVQAAADAVAQLKVLVSTEVAAQLGVTINFSDADGDS